MLGAKVVDLFGEDAAMHAIRARHDGLKTVI